MCGADAVSMKPEANRQFYSFVLVSWMKQSLTRALLRK